MHTTQPALLASGTFVRFFTVPAGHKYELVGTAVTCGTITTANVAGLHTFASTAAVLNFLVQTAAATAGCVSVPGYSEVFEAGDHYDVVWAAGTGNGQGYCWYVDVAPA